MCSCCLIWLRYHIYCIVSPTANNLYYILLAELNIIVIIHASKITSMWICNIIEIHFFISNLVVPCLTLFRLGLQQELVCTKSCNCNVTNLFCFISCISSFSSGLHLESVNKYFCPSKVLQWNGLCMIWTDYVMAGQPRVWLYHCGHKLFWG